MGNRMGSSPIDRTKNKPYSLNGCGVFHFSRYSLKYTLYEKSLFIEFYLLGKTPNNSFRSLQLYFNG